MSLHVNPCDGLASYPGGSSNIPGDFSLQEVVCIAGVSGEGVGKGESGRKYEEVKLSTGHLDQILPKCTFTFIKKLQLNSNRSSWTLYWVNTEGQLCMNWIHGPNMLGTSTGWV